MRQGLAHRGSNGSCLPCRSSSCQSPGASEVVPAVGDSTVPSALAAVAAVGTAAVARLDIRLSEAGGLAAGSQSAGAGSRADRGSQCIVTASAAAGHILLAVRRSHSGAAGIAAAEAAARTGVAAGEDHEHCSRLPSRQTTANT